MCVFLLVIIYKSLNKNVVEDLTMEAVAVSLNSIDKVKSFVNDFSGL